MSDLWEWPGARWWRVDLHTHSPESYDFSNRTAEDEEGWIQWIESARDAGIHAIAVTDHNTAKAVTPLQEAASQVANAPVVFPGVELTASDGSHLLLLVDPSSSETHVDDLLSRVGIAVDQRGLQVSRSSLSVEQILDECGDDALIIGAHVNCSDGLLEHGGQQRIAELRHTGLAAVEVNPNRELDNGWLDGSKGEIGRSLSQVWASDGHDFDRLGQRFAWIKMTQPNLEGLRLALLDGEASLKPANVGDLGDPNGYSTMTIESVTVHDAKRIGRDAPTVIPVNPWFNAIIGGRGTGKSTLVDFCRKTLRRDSELDRSGSAEEGSLRNLFDRRMRVPASRSDEGLLTDNTCIEVMYRKDGERYLLSWSQDGSAQPISRLDRCGLVTEDGDISERFPVRIYSQKQLFALAQDPNALLAVIDDTQDVRSVEFQRRIAQLGTRYLSLRAAARAAVALAGGLPARRATLSDVQRKLDILEQGGHARTLNTYRARRQIDDTWNSILEAVEVGLQSVVVSVDDISVADLELGAEAEDDAPRAALRRAHQSLNRTVREFQRGVRASVDESGALLEGIRTGVDASTWQEAVETSESEYQQTSNQLDQEGITDPTEYGALLDQAASLEDEIRGLGIELARAQSLEDEAAGTLARYRRERRQLSDKRQAFANEASSDTLRVWVGIFADHANLGDDLIDILGIERFEEDRKAIVDRIQPAGNDQWDWDRLDAVTDEIRKFHSGVTDAWQTRDARFERALVRVPPERVDRLALYMPSDDVRVSFRDYRPGSTWRPLSQGSPGQQTAALLAFVLGFGTEPIILDQPEDDLDNTLIYELLVSRFRETKLMRQMIVVTHNPNIVVHGDAEFVVSLDAPRGQTVILCKGGLQERAVRDEICRVMEGGREAFEARYHRIIPPSKSAP